MSLALDARLYRVACRRYGLFTAADASQLGLDADYLARRVEAGTIVRLYRGVYRVAAVPVSWRQNLLAACLAVPGTVIGGQAAAALWGLEPFREESVDLVGPRFKRLSDLRVRQLDLRDGDVTERDGVPVLAVVRVLFDLAARVPLVKLEIAVDSAIRQRLVTPDELCRAAARLIGRGRKGSAKMRAVLDVLGVRPLVGLTRAFCDLLEAADLPLPPEFEYEVLCTDGQRRFVDAAYPRERVAVEIDDYRTHTGSRALDEDLARQDEIDEVLDGWRWRRFTARHIYRRPQWVVDRMAIALGRDPAQHRLPEGYRPRGSAGFSR